MRTKWDVLVERQIKAQAEADRLNQDLEWLMNTECGLDCSNCGTTLVTEADFAKHFVVPDERYLNLGECPNKDQYEIGEDPWL